MNRSLFCRALCLLVVLALGLSVVWAAEEADTAPKHKLPPGSEPYFVDGRAYAGYKDTPDSRVEGQPKKEVKVNIGVNAAAPAAVYSPKAEAELLSAFSALKDHIEGKKLLGAEQIAAQKLIVDQHRGLCGYNDTIIKASFDLVAAYDKIHGPLWVAHKGFQRGKPSNIIPPANDIHWTIYNVMQNIVDYVYTAKNLARYAAVIDNFKFGSSANFPGSVAPPANPSEIHTAKVNAACPKPFKHEVMWQEVPARRPTGTYLAPGSIALVTVPEALVGKSYGVRVGAQSSDHSNRPNVLRLCRSSLVYPITAAETRVASPLGGGIYIEVPLNADGGIVEVRIKNAVRSPFFSATSYRKTSLEDWKNVERVRKAPWADFQTDKFMMQVPTGWITQLDDPVTLMQNWDRAMDAINDLMGLPREWGKETMYLQVDVQNRNSVLSPGYPTCNDHYDPKKEYDGHVNSYLVRGPQYAPDYVFHEQGHGFFFVKFDGEQESTVNLLHVAVWNQKFDYPLDEAFAASRGFRSNNFKTLDNTVVEWMTSLSFAARRPMAAGEKAYQLKGHAKFVDVARLFGWKVLGDFWHTVNEADLEKGIYKRKPAYTDDDLSLRLSKSACVDLTPLLQFWGTPPKNAKAFRSAVAEAKLPPSAKIYDTLVHYKSLVPQDNAALRDFALKWWGKEPSGKGFWTEREHAKQWKEYDEKTSAAIRNTVQEIIDTYFPNGRPNDA